MIQQKWLLRIALLLFSVAISLVLSRMAGSKSLEFPILLRRDHDK
ncbi:MAG: hypothetical protein QNJ32_30855 [Xenococcaceae cyanobacterium MO_167.B27]|nr:hypothetical protein [Xenococcaceae cyanobacterium MO_167.B27]